jgi:hypothetical protein
LSAFGKYPEEIQATKPPNGVFKALALIGKALRFQVRRARETASGRTPAAGKRALRVAMRKIRVPVQGRPR